MKERAERVQLGEVAEQQLGFERKQETEKSPGSCLPGVRRRGRGVSRRAITRAFGRPRQSYKERPLSAGESEQLNILQTVVLTDSLHAAVSRVHLKQFMVKPHG